MGSHPAFLLNGNEGNLFRRSHTDFVVYGKLSSYILSATQARLSVQSFFRSSRVPIMDTR